MEKNLFNQVIDCKKERIYPYGIVHKSKFEKVGANYELNEGRSSILKIGKVVAVCLQNPEIPLLSVTLN